MPSNTVIEDHGERIRTLESNLGEIKTSTALHAQGLEHLVEKIDSGFRAVNERLDRGATQFEDHEARIEAQGTVLAKLETVEAGRASRWGTVKKAILPLLAAGAGVLATKGFQSGSEVFWSWLETLLHIG